MRLHLINDIPLFRAAVGNADPMRTVEHTMTALATTIPARMTFVDYAELERRWHDVLAGQVQRLVLVGTRPPLLTARVRPDLSARAQVIMTQRRHDTAGRTSAVEASPGNGRPEHRHGRILVADDVAMSGTTLHAVLAGLPQTCSVSVRTAFATRHALDRLRAGGVDAASAIVLDYEPVREGTVILLSDLLYGTLRGTDFLAQTELLRPFFGKRLAPLHDLRRVLDATTTRRQPDQLASASPAAGRTRA
jgi:hypothetical protein